MAKITGTIEEVLRSIKKGAVPSCMLIYGDESFLVNKALEEIIETIYPSGVPELSLFLLDGERTGVERICETVLTPSLLAGRKVVVVKNTALLTSRTTASALLSEAAARLSEDRQAAARAFLRFLALMGWSFEEVAEGEWKKLSEAEWQSAAGGREIKGEELFPAMLALCRELGLTRVPSAGDTGRLESILEGALPDTVNLILTAVSADKRKRLFKIISDRGAVLHYPRVTQEAKQKQLLSEAAAVFLAERGKKINPDAFAALGDRAGFTLDEALGALDKLATYLGSDRSVIEKADVETVIGVTKEEKVFALTAALAEKNLDQSIIALRRLLEQELHPLMILSMIIREVRLLIQGKILLASGIVSSSIPGRFSDFQTRVYPSIRKEAEREGKGKVQFFGQHPYVMYNVLKNSQRFSWRELMDGMDRLVETDITLKSSAARPQLVMERLLIDLCGK